MTDLNLTLMDDEPTQAARRRELKFSINVDPATEGAYRAAEAENEYTAAGTAATDSETQSIHAWALDSDDTEPVSHRRSWKLPIALASLAAAAAVTTGVVMAWPQQQHPHHPAPPQPTKAAEPTVIRADADKAPQYVPPTDPDGRFAWLLREQGIPVQIPQDVAIDGAQGRAICVRLSHGETDQQMMQDIMAGTPGISPHDAWTWVDNAIAVFCPRN
jgi:hypothetical protein